MADLLTWEDIKNELGTNCSVLLGNGFSRSYCNKAFNQYQILQHMPSLQDLHEIVDIEKCIEQTQAKVSDENPNLTVPKVIIDRWIKSQLHKEFIDTLYNLMPKSLNDIEDFTDEKLTKYKDFFNYFNKVFTLNYDPLLYWMTMRFINFGDKDIVDYSNLKEQLSSIPEGTKEYTDLKKKLDSTNDKCIKSVRNEMFSKYMKENEDYKLSISCKEEILLQKSIAESEGKILGGWTKVIPEVYKAFEAKKTENELLSEESNKLNSIATSALETKLQSVEHYKEDMKLRVKDGFLSEIWNEKNDQTIFYLHGAFHLIENNEETIKVKSEEFNKMVDKIKQKWDSGFEPLTVLESTPEAKAERISKSPYLTKCYNEFKTLSGTLLTHGLSFMNSDKHIIEAINNNANLEKIYVGCFNQPTKDIEEAFKDNDRVVFFNTYGMFC
ncbi:TPA: hypothetical protein CPT96_00630 [Candidatus Gastranaerophilales bacterium HUM_10]|nr:MAG TPA: hypothetical protein CPT96_00630 [Candidatus Gastranaerophilales bacterium HUM_10]